MSRVSCFFPTHSVKCIFKSRDNRSINVMTWITCGAMRPNIIFKNYVMYIQKFINWFYNTLYLAKYVLFHGKMLPNRSHSRRGDSHLNATEFYVIHKVYMGNTLSARQSFTSTVIKNWVGDRQLTSEPDRTDAGPIDTRPSVVTRNPFA